MVTQVPELGVFVSQRTHLHRIREVGLNRSRCAGCPDVPKGESDSLGVRLELFYWGWSGEGS